MTPVTIRQVFFLRFVLIRLKSLLIGFYEVISFATDVSESFVRAYV